MPDVQLSRSSMRHIMLKLQAIIVFEESPSRISNLREGGIYQDDTLAALA